MLSTLVSFLAASTLLAISPGPDNIYVLTQSIVNGTRSGIATTAGLVAGCIVHTSLVAFGVSALIVASPRLFFAIKLLGIGYLLYLAFKVFKSSTTITTHEVAPKKSYFDLFKQGILMNVLNPK